MNNENQNRLDHLFDAARKEEPKTSFSDVQKTFVAATSLGIIGLIINWFVGASKVAKIGIMISTITAATVGVTMIVSSPKIVETDVSSKENLSHTTIQQVVEEPVPENAVIYSDLPEESKVEEKKKPLKRIFQSGLDFKPLSAIEFKQTNSNIIQRPLILDEKRIEIVKFVITENTTETMLNSILKQAKEAGIKFKHTAKYRKSILKKLTIDMVIERDEKRVSQQQIKISGSDDFNVTIGWVQDEEGKATEFYSNEMSELGSIEHLENWADDLVESLNLDSFETDSLEKIEMNLEELEYNLETKIDGLVNTIILNLESDLEATEEKLNEWKIDVEDYSKKLVINLDSADFKKLSSDELKTKLKSLETDLEKLIEDLELELKKE